MYYGNVTFVLALPRSRTAWLAETFGNGNSSARTLHDPLKRCASIEDLAVGIDVASEGEYHNEPVIVVDTAAMFFYPQIVTRFPCARFLFVHRHPKDVEASLARAGQPVNTQAINEAHQCMNFAGVLADADGRYYTELDVSALSNVGTLQNLWQFFGIPDAPAPGYFERMIATNIQIPFDVQQARTDRNKVERLMATRHQGW